MNEWIDELSDLAAAGESAVVVTVARIRGSAPREPGAKMIVTSAETIGTIGGGQLEYQCARIAADMLAGDAGPFLRRFPLGASFGQCCGGVVDILFERMPGTLPGWLRDLRSLYGQRKTAVVVTGTGADDGGKAIVTAADVYGDMPSAEILTAARRLCDAGETELRDAALLEPVRSCDFNIAVFGAGHVGTAVVAALSGLDCNIRWIDSRRGVFRGAPRNVRVVETGEPALEVAALPPASCYLVMTHSHALDFDICVRILERGDAVYAGLIGSRSKRRRFEKRFRQQGISQARIDRLVCPIGIDGIRGKKPAEIAIAAAAEVLRARELSITRASDVYSGNVRPFKA